jgi:hypothetical protein
MVGRPFLGGLAVFLFSVSQAWAQSDYSTHLDYNAQTNVFGAPPQSETNSLDGSGDYSYLTASGGFEQRQTNNTGASGLGFDDDAIVSYSGFANVGGVGAAVSGTASSQTESYFLGSTSASAGAGFNASWTDFAEMYYPNEPIGQTLHVNASLIFHGTYSAAASGTVLANQHFATWGVSASITGLDALAADQGATGMSVNIAENGNITSILPQQTYFEEIPISFLVQNGNADALGVELSVGGSASVQTGAVDPTVVTADFVGDFKDTLAWGGITSVYDPVADQYITGYTFTSASGFDYTQPYPVPEPCSVAGTLFGSALLLRRYRRLNSRP